MNQNIKPIHSFFHRALEGNNKWWTYLAGFVMISAGMTIGQLPLTAIIIIQMIRMSKGDSSKMEEANEKLMAYDFSYFGLDANLSFFLILLTFVGVVLFLWITIKHIHKRPFKSLITPLKKVNWKRVGIGFAIWFSISAGLEVVSYFSDPSNYVWTFEWQSFIILLLLCIFILPLQTSAEELVMRGYMMQGLGFIFRYPIIPLVITSVIFGLLHIMNPEVEKFGLWNMMTIYIGMGFMLGLITLLDESLELALGIHFGNNLFGALFVSFDGSALQTPTMFRTLEMDSDNMVVGWLIVSTLFILLLQLIFKWKNWGKLFRPIQYPTVKEESPVV